jgi:hypothetical protein
MRKTRFRIGGVRIASCRCHRWLIVLFICARQLAWGATLIGRLQRNHCYQEATSVSTDISPRHAVGILFAERCGDIVDTDRASCLRG